MWAKLIYFFEAFFLFFIQIFERWFLALTGVSGLAGGAVACLLFILSSGYFFPELREKSKTLFLAAGFVSLLGGTLLFNEIGHWMGVTPDWSQESQADSSGTSTLLEPPVTGDSGTISTSDQPSVQPETTEQAGTLPPEYPSYTALAASDGSWPQLWSDVSSAAYALSNVPAGAEVQLTGDCVTDQASNSWCPVSYAGQTGWIASVYLSPK